MLQYQPASCWMGRLASSLWRWSTWRNSWSPFCKRRSGWGNLISTSLKMDSLRWLDFPTDFVIRDQVKDHPLLENEHYLEGYFHGRRGKETIKSLKPRDGQWMDKPAAPPRLRALVQVFIFSLSLSSVLWVQATKAKNEELLTAIAETFPEGSAMKRLLDQGEALQDLSVQVRWLCPAPQSQNKRTFADQVWWGSVRAIPCMACRHLQLGSAHGRCHRWLAHLISSTPGGGQCRQVCDWVGNC